MTWHFTEDAAVEQPAIALLHELSWETYDAYHEFDGGASPLGRDSMGEVVLLSRLRPALRRLNPGLPAEALELAMQELARDRSAMSLAAANREVYALLKHGVKVAYRPRDDADECSESVRVSLETMLRGMCDPEVVSSAHRQLATVNSQPSVFLLYPSFIPSSLPSNALHATLKL
jgi:hypothetical protein